MPPLHGQRLGVDEGLYDVLKYTWVKEVHLYYSPISYRREPRDGPIVRRGWNERVELHLHDGEVVRLHPDKANFIFIPPEGDKAKYATYRNQAGQTIAHFVSRSCRYESHNLQHRDTSVR